MCAIADHHGVRTFKFESLDNVLDKLAFVDGSSRALSSEDSYEIRTKLEKVLDGFGDRLAFRCHNYEASIWTYAEEHFGYAGVNPIFPIAYDIVALHVRGNSTLNQVYLAVREKPPEYFAQWRSHALQQIVGARSLDPNRLKSVLDGTHDARARVC